MNNSSLLDKVVTSPAQSLPKVPKDSAVSFVAAFDVIKRIVGKYPAPKRPNRNKPINTVASGLRASLELATQTPALDELRALADEHAPPLDFFDGDVERPW